MAIYVDDMNAPYRGEIISHLVADTREELLQAANQLGIDLATIQRPNTPWEHFDIPENSKQEAISIGAQEVTQSDVVQLIHRKKRESRKRGRKSIPVDVLGLNQLLKKVTQ